MTTMADFAGAHDLPQALAELDRLLQPCLALSQNVPDFWGGQIAMLGLPQMVTTLQKLMQVPELASTAYQRWLESLRPAAFPDLGPAEGLFMTAGQVVVLDSIWSVLSPVLRAKALVQAYLWDAGRHDEAVFHLASRLGAADHRLRLSLAKCKVAPHQIAPLRDRLQPNLMEPADESQEPPLGGQKTVIEHALRLWRSEGWPQGLVYDVQAWGFRFNGQVTPSRVWATNERTVGLLKGILKPPNSNNRPPTG
ncbi:MAG: hypothetical protein V1797_08675 [Pseudomonadota bacterium]